MARAGELSVPELPANPRVLGQLLSALGESGATSASLARLILTDPALTLAVLRAVLAGTGFPDSSRGFSMEACVDALGRDLLQAYALLRATRQVAAGLSDATPGPLTHIWRHSLVCAHAAAELARAAGKPEQECYLAGLLCDIGTLARHGAGGAAPTRAPAPGELSWDDSEATVIVLAETDGAWIGRGWLPPFVADALRLRKESARVLADAPFVVRVLKVALAVADAGAGASEAARMLGKELLGLDEQQVTGAAETASAAARELHLGLETASDADAANVAGRSRETPAPADTGRAPGDPWIDLGEAVGEAAFRQILYQALAAAGNGHGVLERLRRAWRLLTRLEQHYFFMADAQATALTGTPLADDAPELAELRAQTASSHSLLARAAREKRLVHAFGAPVTEEGSALDRVLARMLGSEGLLCLPLLAGSRLQGVAVFGLGSQWSEEQGAEGALLARLAASAGAAVMQAEQAREQQERIRNALTAQFQALGKRVVHEAANPLSVVKNYLAVLGNKLGDAHRFGEELGILNEELDRIGRIVQRMGAPFTAESGEAARVDLNATVKEVMTLTSQTLIGRGIEVQQQLDPRIPVLQGDAVGLKQVVLNLVTNAVEAMPDGGRLTIVSADNVNLSGEPFVLLQITDTGKGIAPESMARLFQAGFSTKGEGHEGIGLSVSESIVRGMGGRILCRSHQARGTIFVVLLPRRAAGNSVAGGAPVPTP
jgi:signal transduction histidine kinase